MCVVVCVCSVCVCGGGGVYTCNSEIREPFYSSSVFILFREISLDKIFNFLKEISIFDKILSLRSFLVLCVF